LSKQSFVLFLRTSGNVKVIEESTNPQELDMSTNEEGVDSEADDYRASLSPDISSSYIATRQSKKQKKSSTESLFQSKIIKLLQTDETPDPDTTILMSFLPKLRMLTEDQKTDFQIYVLQFFKNLSRPYQPNMYNYLQPINSYVDNPTRFQNIQTTTQHQLTQLHSPSAFNQPQTYTSTMQHHMAQQQAFEAEPPSTQGHLSEYPN